MKFLIYLIPFFIMNCASSEIMLNRDSVNSVKKIIIVPFSSKVDVKKEIIAETEETFRSLFSKLNYQIVDKEKNGKTAAFSGTDAVLSGEILEYKEFQQDMPSNRYHTFGTLLFNRDHDEIKTKTIFRFQIILKLVKVSDGEVIMTIKNRYMEAEKDEYLPGYLSMDSYRRLVLGKMAEELVNMFSRKY